jgi:hypothetical protein
MQRKIIDDVVLTHATTSCVYTYNTPSNKLYQTWLDGSGHVINYDPDSERGRKLVSMIARKGFAKKVA